jgi:GNAT superfamily N-acetyltransferase
VRFVSQELITWYLQLDSLDELVPVSPPREGLEVHQAKLPLGVLNRFFYLTVGRDWHWTDKADWSPEQWQHYAEQPSLSLWIGYQDKTPFGYFELNAQATRTELAYFGVLPQFLGKGLGRYLLYCALKTALTQSKLPVWVHTCSWDHPAALHNYQARGLKIYQETREFKSIQQKIRPPQAT